MLSLHGLLAKDTKLLFSPKLAKRNHISVANPDVLGNKAGNARPDNIIVEINSENVDECNQSEHDASDDDATSVDLTVMDRAEANDEVTDEELFEMLAGKHRFQDVGKILHIGIIDYLTTFGCKKAIELKAKSLAAPKHTISVQHPTFYGERFLDFMVERVLGGDSEPV